MNTKWACVHDLLNYFKKSDLLGGLTLTELEQLRRNIGLGFLTEGENKVISIKYDALWDLIKTKLLSPGTRYLITDYLTIYSSNVEHNNVKITWGKDINPSETYTIATLAISAEVLDSNVKILEHPNWIVRYDVTKKALEDGISNRGTITYLKDENNNSAFYDFKNIKFLRGNKLYYTFSEVLGNTIVDGSTLHNTHNNQLEEDCWNNVFLGDTYNNILKLGCTGNSFNKGAHDNIILWNTSNNTFNEPVCYLSGLLSNQVIKSGDSVLSSTITKTVHKVNEATIVSFLDPITYSYQVIILK